MHITWYCSCSRYKFNQSSKRTSWVRKVFETYKTERKSSSEGTTRSAYSLRSAVRLLQHAFTALDRPQDHNPNHNHIKKSYSDHSDPGQASGLTLLSRMFRTNQFAILIHFIGFQIQEKKQFAESCLSFGMSRGDKETH